MVGEHGGSEDYQRGSSATPVVLGRQDQVALTTNPYKDRLVP
jgi:hypothetical protein